MILDITPLISVIIPVYNVKHYLREALESVIGQTYQNLEIIVIDDGSTDGSELICDEYVLMDSRVKVYHQPNLGLSAARNFGINQATGQLIAFLDSDDVFLPTMIEKMVAEMRNTGADITICGFWGKGRNKAFLKGIYTKDEALRELLRGGIDTAVWNKLYSRSLWNDIRFPEGHVYEGTRVTYKLLNEAQIISILPYRLIIHRNRHNSITNSNSLENSLDSMIANEEFENFVRMNTPAIFTTSELNTFLEHRLRGAIIFWANIVKMDESEADKVRKSIHKLSEDVHVKSMTTMVILTLFKRFPAILKYAIPLYLYMKR